MPLALIAILCLAPGPVQEAGLDEKILGRADKLLEEAKASYESGREKRSVADFVDAGFKLEEARIKYQVVQEIGSPEKQKVAAERLRALNQLTKLIHDGRTAISGVPAERPGAEPAVPDPNAPVAAPPTSAAPLIDVTKRVPLPDAAKQRDAEKQIKDLFKEQYGKKGPADRKLLAKLLLDQAARSQDDPAALWVLCREAQEVAIQICDTESIVRSTEIAARVLDVDALALKNAALQGAGRVAKSPEEFAAVADALLRQVDDLIAADQFEVADKSAAAALQHAKKSGDGPLTIRSASRSKEVAEAKSLYQSSKSGIGVLAKSPEDPAANAEMGKFLCFVKGNWDLGLRFLVKGPADTLKALAEKELAAPTASADRLALADGWWELAEKEKSALRKSQMLVHARPLYESALPDATALARAKIERRMTELNQQFPEAPGGAVDLLRLVEERDIVAGTWKIEPGKLRSPTGASAHRIQIPYTPPAEYSVTVVAERKEGTNCLMVGLTAEGRQFRVQIDGWYGGDITALDSIDGTKSDSNETSKKGRFLPKNKAVSIVVTVRKTGVTAVIDGKTVVDWKGVLSRLSVSPEYGTSNQNALYLGCWDTQFEITKVVLTPISGGSGKRLR